MTSAPRARLVSLDAVRGLAMVVMALDHARDFFGAPRFDPTDLSRHPGAALFLTRWVTHYCAPSFVLLAGTSAYLWRAAGRTGADASRFLATRGLWLVLLELTVVGAAWRFTFDGKGFGLQVIWVLGASMILLAAIARLPLRAVGLLGALLVVLHDALDGVHADALGAWRTEWIFLHEPGVLRWSGRVVFVVYPLVPWVGVMAVGYAMGPLFRADRAPADRRRLLGKLGVGLVGLFFAMRLSNLYGDPRPWTPGATTLETLLATLNCNKYPPSLDFLAMTLGPALLLLAALTRVDEAGAAHPVLGPVARTLAVFGKVPLFYYVAHLWILRGLAVLVDLARHGSVSPFLRQGSVFAFPDEYGFSLPVVYGVWLAVVAALYPACAWFAGVKARHKGEAWVSYV